MLQGNLSTQDEEDVEDELEALQQELAEPVFPVPPTKVAPKSEPVEARARAETETEAQTEETRVALPA